MHNDNDMFFDRNVMPWRNDPANKAKSTAGDDRSPAWTWMAYLYTENNQVVVPADNLMTMLREGGAKCPTGKGKTTFKRQTQSGLVVDQSAWPVMVNGRTIQYEPFKKLIGEEDFFAHDEFAADSGFMLFVKRAVVGRARHTRVRPRFDRWQLSGTITVLDDTITTDALERILVFGGMYAGLCDWRPSSRSAPGPYGKFTVELKQVDG
jgi:hypothetical protein